jgi:hypothetical protein
MSLLFAVENRVTQCLVEFVAFWFPYSETEFPFPYRKESLGPKPVSVVCNDKNCPKLNLFFTILPV